MELKLEATEAHPREPKLLIVPYGIETFLRCYCLCEISYLLIVPYGIETTLYRHAVTTVANF